MRRASLADPKSQTPRASAMSMLTGFMVTARRPATSILRGGVGTMAAKIRTTTPAQLISGRMGGAATPTRLKSTVTCVIIASASVVSSK